MHIYAINYVYRYVIKLSILIEWGLILSGVSENEYFCIFGGLHNAMCGLHDAYAFLVIEVVCLHGFVQTFGVLFFWSV